MADIASFPMVRQDGTPAYSADLKGKTVAFYFSAHWCPPCRGFTPMLRKFYETLKARGEDIEIVFFSSDRDPASFEEYFKNDHGPWLAVKFGSPEIKQVAEHYQCRGIPHLVVVNAKGECVVSADEARGHVGGAKSEEDVLKAFKQWKNAAGDWRESAGTALGGAKSAPANDAAAMRAARLARLGGGPAPAAPTQPAVAPAPAPPAGGGPSAAPAETPGATPAPSPPPAPAAATYPAEAPDARIQQLKDMGFSEEQCRSALDAAGGDPEQALELLLASG